MKYSGIDLHSNNCVVVVTDEEDRVGKRSPPCSVNVNFPEIYAAAKISMS